MVIINKSKTAYYKRLKRKKTMKTFEQKYDGYDSNGEHIEKTGEFVKVSQIEKVSHEVATYRHAVDWCQSNYYIVDGIVYCEDTHWENGSRLVGSGVARNTGKSIEEYFGEALKNYVIRKGN